MTHDQKVTVCRMYRYLGRVEKALRNGDRRSLFADLAELSGIACRLYRMLESDRNPTALPGRRD